MKRADDGVRLTGWTVWGIVGCRFVVAAPSGLCRLLFVPERQECGEEGFWFRQSQAVTLTEPIIMIHQRHWDDAHGIRGIGLFL